MKSRHLVLVLLMLLSLWSGWALRGHVAVDACLDAGGKWQVEGQYCQGVR